MGIEDIYWITPEFSVAVAGIVGLLVGSFLNVVIHRLPLMMQAQWEAELEEALAQLLHEEQIAFDGTFMQQKK